MCPSGNTVTLLKEWKDGGNIWDIITDTKEDYWDQWVFWYHPNLTTLVVITGDWYKSCSLLVLVNQLPLDKGLGFICMVSNILSSPRILLTLWNSDTLLMMLFTCFLCLTVPTLASSQWGISYFTSPISNRSVLSSSNLTVFIPLSPQTQTPILAVLLPCGCSWNVGNASYARTVIPQHFLCRGNYPL